MRKLLTTIIIILIIMMSIVGCSSNKKSEEELREEIKAELEKEMEASNNENEIENKQNIRIELTNEQIEAIANDLVASFNLFNEETPSIGEEEAESFSYYLVFKKGEQNIIDNYISVMDNLKPSSTTEIKNGVIDGKYIEALSKAIFDVDINPKNQYTDEPYDPALVDSKLKEVKKENGKYIAVLEILDVMENPYLTMELHLSLTDEGFTRVEYLSTKEINNALKAEDIVDINDLKVGTKFNGGTIKTIDYKANDSIKFDLEGELTLEGYFYYDDMYGETMFSFKDGEFPTGIKLDNDFSFYLPKFGLFIKNNDLINQKLSKKQIEKMKNDWSYQIPVTIKIKDYSFSAKFESEGGASAKLLEIIKIEDDSKALPQNETIRDTFIDYENSNIVAIEAYDGINKDILEIKKYTTEAYEEYPITWKVAIFGTAYNLRVETTAGMEAETKTTNLIDELTNTEIQFSTSFPTDFSVDVLIFEDENGNEYSVILEDMSDEMDIVQVEN